MAQVNPQDFSFHLKKDDIDPSLKIRLIDSDTELAFDLTGYTGKFYMALRDTSTVLKINGSAVNITSEVLGEAQYDWSGTDTDTVGEYLFEFRFTKSSKTFTMPTVSPGVVIIESKLGPA